MRTLYVCVAAAHDRALLLLAVAVCVAGVYAAFFLGGYALSRAEADARRLWTAASAFSAASAVWATHFIAMLSFRPGAPVGFEPFLTADSFVVAVLLIGGGAAGAMLAGTAPGRAAAGALAGAGVGAMHYLGMASYEVAGSVGWNTAAVAGSVLAGTVLAGASGVAARSARRVVRACAPPLLVLSVCAVHFVGMAAETIAPDPLAAPRPGTIPPERIAVAVAAAAMLVAALAGTALWLDTRSRLHRRRERDRLRDLADVAVEGLLICDGERVVCGNQSVAALCGRDRASLPGTSLTDLLDGVRLAEIPQTGEGEAMLRAPDGPPIPVRVLRRALPTPGRSPARGALSVVAVRDQRDRIRVEAEMRGLAFCDALTGLPNRARFHAELDALAGAHGGLGRGLAVLMVDLDRFKLVNDTLGHGVGDLVLQRAAGRLRKTVPPGDLVARLGGDEFAVLQAGPGSPEQARVVAARIVDVLGRPFLVDGNVVDLGASVGVALAPQDGETPELLVRHADLALYKAKSDGRGAYRMFEAELDAAMQARRSLEIGLRRAVARKEFELHYQPLVDARSGDVLGAEALIRWRDPGRGLVSPAEFIPLAEETGMIAAIGQWVLRTACAEAAGWPERLSVAVNLSPVQFRDPRLADMVGAVLTATGLAPERLELEVTEGVLIAHDERTLATLTALRALGVRISMDDFGTGYSSLSCLLRFPFDKIKVDQSFIRQVPENAECAAIVRAIITMGACLGMRTTVEGVETAAQLAFTAAEGCDQVQGYFLSRPLPAATFAEFVRVREAA